MESMARRKPPEGPDDRKGRPKAEPSQDELFRRWLEQQLHRRFDPVLEEPVPDDLLDLLRPQGPQGSQE
jgi:hypothetical protein